MSASKSPVEPPQLGADDARVAEPARLALEDAGLSDLLGAANEQYAAGLGANKLDDWLAPDALQGWKRRRMLWFVAAVAAGFALAVTGGFLARNVTSGAPELASKASPILAKPTAKAWARSNAPAVAVEVARSLGVGETRLSDGSRVRVEPGGVASVRPASGGTEVAIEAGKVSFEVAPQPPAHRFRVSAAAYTFSVLGTRFTVSSASQSVVLEVREGKVQVAHGKEVLAVLVAGQRWASDGAPSERAPAAGSSTDVGSAAAPPAAALPSAGAVDCLALARQKRPRDAEACFREQAREPGITGELALFEVARLRSDVLADPSGALAALDEHRQRFPSGSLRGEVDVSHVELLARLGRRTEALAESGSLLQTDTGRERRSELHLLRAGIYRNGLKDVRAAEREYAAAESAGGARSADASYQRGRCLEELGDREGARAAYQRYLVVPGRKREAEVRGRLTELER